MPSGVYKRTNPVWNKGLTKETDERIEKSIVNRKKADFSVQERQKRSGRLSTILRLSR